jgi:hypothetical protein
MDGATAGPLHAFLAGTGQDGAGRSIEDVLALPDGPLEHIHDYIQWLFPLPTRSMAQPTAPVLTEAETAAIRADPPAQANLRRATERMLAFYHASRSWLVWSDHNHLRISRIIQSLRILAGDAAARAFFEEISTMVAAAGAPIDPRNRRYWERAVGN